MPTAAAYPSVTYRRTRRAPVSRARSRAIACLTRPRRLDPRLARANLRCSRRRPDPLPPVRDGGVQQFAGGPGRGDRRPPVDPHHLHTRCPVPAPARGFRAESFAKQKIIAELEELAVPLRVKARASGAGKMSDSAWIAVQLEELRHHWSCPAVYLRRVHRADAGNAKGTASDTRLPPATRASGQTLTSVQPHAGSQRQPSLSLQMIASPSPATPVAPWSLSRQYSPGS